MRKHISAESKSAEINMLMKRRQFKNKVFILLEGKTDIKLFRKLFNLNNVQLESLDGKSNVNNTVSSVKRTYDDRIIGICDADFDHLNEIVANSEIFLTDYHDTETMIIKSKGLDPIISEYCKESYFDGVKRNLLKKSLELAYNIGLLKYANNLENIGLNFKEIDFENFIDIDNLRISMSVEELINEVIHHSDTANYSMFDDLKDKVEELREHDYCPYMLCCGHDLSKIISRIMSQNEISIDTNLGQDKIESLLRVSYNYDDFKLSKLYYNLIAWSRDKDKDIFCFS